MIFEWLEAVCESDAVMYGFYVTFVMWVRVEWPRWFLRYFRYVGDIEVARGVFFPLLSLCGAGESCGAILALLSLRGWMYGS